MRAPLIIALFVILVACGRPLTAPEAAYMADLQGDTFDAAPVRITRNPLIGLIVQRYPARPQTTCRERVGPPPEGPIIEGRTGGMVLFNTLHVREDIMVDDYTLMPDGRRHLYAAMFFAHEMTHVWQWQNREITGYHPLRAAREHATLADPYLFDTTQDRHFLDYGYEAQASLVEEYVCCRAIDPQGARTARLEALIGQVMPVTPWRDRADSVELFLPWDGVEPRGMCS
ncbi:hypothetical protein [Roseicyclus mahoneyensis]|uniref:Uncharacterized protein n=1 Tax=Roseicyclus mahoneyensis TaxID=164332 RepID=A0A316GRK1_9RHOB|nr:hypothetical protein [Roseicyclus mahoneyensis]PWK62662.1 hypothetical protein C7455_101692 [Roseicyclus mahoneyensis]